MYIQTAGVSQFNSVYAFKTEIRGIVHNMVMTSVTGHLCQPMFEEPFGKWECSDVADPFHVAVEKKVQQQNVNIAKTLKREVAACDLLILWTNCDSEGESIGFEIADVCSKQKENLPVFRARFSAITEAAVHAAANKLVRLNKHLSAAVDVRTELDFRSGTYAYMTLR